MATGNNTGSRHNSSVNKRKSSTLQLDELTDVYDPVTEGYTKRYIRAKNIVFKAQGLKPNTIYYPFFKNVYVGQYCSAADSPSRDSEGMVLLAARDLQTDTLGNLTGNFYLPANTFYVGDHAFKLVDSVDTSAGTPGSLLNVAPKAVYGFVETTYNANTTLKDRSSQITADVDEDSNLSSPYSRVNSINSDTGASGVVPLPPAVCREYYFEYTVTGVESSTFIITTNSAAAPSSPSHSVGMVDAPAGTTTYKYLETYTAGTGTYEHKFLRTTTSATKKYRQSKIIKEGETADLPNLSGFTPTGINEEAVVTIVTSGDVGAVNGGWILKDGTATCDTSQGTKINTQADPIGQSFYIDPSQYPDGMFITSLAVYFKAVDQAVPVIAELRDMNSGIPGPNIMPGGKVVLPGYATTSSSDATIPSLFRFEQPVYLKASTTYCFVLKSPSLGYDVWCSRVGEKDVTTKDLIDTIPFDGTLFKSENDVTWLPDLYEDIKFDLYRADYDTSASGQLRLNPQSGGGQYYTTGRDLPMSYISTTNSSTVVGIKIPRHGLLNNDLIDITGATSAVGATGIVNGIEYSELNAQHTVTYVDDDNITISLTTAATRTGNIIQSDFRNNFSDVPGIMPTDISATPAEQLIDTSNTALATIPGATAYFNQPTLTGITSANTFKVYTNIIANEVGLDYVGADFDDTTIQELVSLQDTNYNTQSVLDLTDEPTGYYKGATEYMVASIANESAKMIDNNYNAEVQLNLSSTNKHISPVVDLSNVTLNTKTYLINNQNEEITTLIANSAASETDYQDSSQNSEITAGSTVALAKYKSEVVTFDKDYNCLSIFVVGNCPSPAAIDVYTRLSADQFTHIDRPWRWLPLSGVFGTAFANSPDTNAQNEWYYECNLNPSEDAPETRKFNTFDIKIVMRSTNSSVVPKIYGVRAIANII